MVTKINSALGTKEVHVYMPDERVDTWRPTKAEDLGEGLFKILPLEGGNFNDEKWEFPPGSIVRVQEKMGYKGSNKISILVAVKA